MYVEAEGRSWVHSEDEEYLLVAVWPHHKAY